MRILHISTRLILGGSQENTVLSCEGQARLGHEVHLAFGPIFGPEGSHLERVKEFNRRCERGEEKTRAGSPCHQIITHELPHLIREVRPIADHLCFHRELRPLIRNLKPDIVHTHSSKAGILGRWAAARERAAVGKPMGIVHTIHGPPFMPIEGGPARRLTTRLNNFAYTLAERFAARRCDVIVSVAQAMTDLFLAKGIGRPEQHTTVWSGIEAGDFLNAAPGEDRNSVRAAMGFRPDDFVIGTVARLAEHKGHDDLLEALTDDLKSHPNWKLLWVGDGWWRERLIAKAEGMGHAVREFDKDSGGEAAEWRSGKAASGPATSSLRHSVTPSLLLTGLVPPDRIPGFLRAMDVLVHPSYREGLPRTVPQALLAGVCPVAYDADGTREVCRDMDTGRLIRLGDRAGLRHAVGSLYDHPDERHAMAQRGRAWCAERFPAEVMVARLEEAYITALGRRSPPR